MSLESTFDYVVLAIGCIPGLVIVYAIATGTDWKSGLSLLLRKPDADSSTPQPPSDEGLG